MAAKNKRKIFILEPIDVRILSGFVREAGFGPRGESAAMRRILREWNEMRRNQPAPQPTQDAQR